MKSWLPHNGIETYSPDNEGKSVVAERLLGPWKVKFGNISIP